MTKLQKLIKECPCKVHFGITDPPYNAYFDHFTGEIFLTDQCKQKHQLFVVLAHEQQHALCHKTGCFCMLNKRYYYREHHAFKAEILQCLHYKQALQWAVDDVRKRAVRPICLLSSGHHTKACRNLMKTKLWKTALKKLKEN